MQFNILFFTDDDINNKSLLKRRPCRLTDFKLVISISGPCGYIHINEG